jgi:hypothetical protein
VHRTSLLIVVCALLLAGCGQRPPPAAAPPPAAPPAAPAAARVRAQAIAAAVAGRPSVDGHRDGPGGDAAWRAFFAGDELALIEERVADPPRPPLENRYYFENGTLFYFAGQQTAEPGSGADGAAARVPVLAEFHGAQATSAVRIEHYGAVPLAPGRVATIAARAAELAAAARDEHSARQVAP